MLKGIYQPVLVCSNAAGTHKCRVLVIGKSANPRLIKGLKKSGLPIIYKNFKKAWLTQQICT